MTTTDNSSDATKPQKTARAQYYSIWLLALHSVMGLEQRCAGVVRGGDTPLSGQLSIHGQAVAGGMKIAPETVPMAATGLLKDRRSRKDVKSLRKQEPSVILRLALFRHC